MHTAQFLLAASLLSLGIPLSAKEISLEEALGAARADNTELKVATLELSRSQRENSVNDWLPSLSLELGASLSASIIDQSKSASYTIGGISWSINSASLSSNKAKRALAGESALLTYQSKINSIESRVTTAYWNAEAARLAWQSKQNALEREERDLETTKQKYEASRATTLSVSQANMSVADAKYQEQIAHQTYQNALRTLSNLTKLEIGEEDTFQAMPELFTLKESTTLLKEMDKTTTIKQYSLAIAQAEQNLKSTKATNQGVSVNVSAKTSLGDSIYSYRNDKGNWGFDDLADTTTLGVTVSVPLDHLFGSSSDRIAIDSASYELQIARLNFQKALDDLEEEVKDALTSVSQAEDNLQLLETHLALARTQLKLTQESYDAGKSSYSDLDDTKKSVSDAELAMVQQQLNHTIALYDLATLLECPIAQLAQ